MPEDLKNLKIKNHYDSTIAGKRFRNNYEFNRWFKAPRLRLDYFMTYSAINYHLQRQDFSSCLEFGPGPGTWTRVLYRKNPQAHFDLVDISQEMKNQFQLEMREQANVNYIVSDIANFTTDKKYDLFFSARAIDYLEDKEALFKLLTSCLTDSAKGIIIAKNPERGWRRKEIDKRWQHSGQIKIDDLQKKLKYYGFKDFSVYPAVIRVPVLDKYCLNVSENIFKKVFYQPITRFITKLAESYIVIFNK